MRISIINFDEFHREKEGDSNVDANLHGVMDFSNTLISWDMYKRSTSGASLYPSKYVEAYRLFMKTYKEKGILPLLAYFSDSFPHKNSKFSDFAKKEINNQYNIIRNFGYYQWDNESACSLIWQLRFVNSIAKKISLSEENSEVNNEVAFIENRLISFSQPINEDCDDNFVIEKFFFAFESGKNPELWLKLKNGIQIRFNALPAGYKRLYSIILDISYRAYFLNRKKLGEPSGIVLIDEVDLHLHPSLSIEIMQRFTNVFPEIQFIVSTHSPLVIANLKTRDDENKIFRIVYGEERPHILPDIYGIDYNASLTDVMGGGYSNEDISFLRSSILRSLRRKREDLADSKKNELRKIVSKKRYDEIMTEIEIALKEN